MKAKISFNDLINSDKPVLVDFSAEWCGPCKMMGPILKELAQSVGDDAKIVKIDVDRNKNLAQKLNVMGVPTLMVFKEGKLLWRQSGVHSARQLENILQEAQTTTVQ